jgi:hypothetical protein
MLCSELSNAATRTNCKVAVGRNGDGVGTGVYSPRKTRLLPLAVLCSFTFAIVALFVSARLALEPPMSECATRSTLLNHPSLDEIRDTADRRGLCVDCDATCVRVAPPSLSAPGWLVSPALSSSMSSASSVPTPDPSSFLPPLSSASACVSIATCRRCDVRAAQRPQTMTSTPVLRVLAISFTSKLSSENHIVAGVATTGTPGKGTMATSVIIFSVNLTGTIPPEIGELTAMSRLELYKNQITGSIPLEMSSLAALAFL